MDHMPEMAAPYGYCTGYPSGSPINGLRQEKRRPAKRLMGLVIFPPSTPNSTDGLQRTPACSNSASTWSVSVAYSPSNNAYNARRESGSTAPHSIKRLLANGSPLLRESMFESVS